MFNSKGDLKIILAANYFSLVIMTFSLFVFLAGIKYEVQAYGFIYNVTRIINNVSQIEEVNVMGKFNFAGVILFIVLINILNVVHFRSRLYEVLEEEDRDSGPLLDNDRSCDQFG